MRTFAYSSQLLNGNLTFGNKDRRPADAQWAGLSQIAQSKAKSTAVAKAQKLLQVLKKAARN